MLPFVYLALILAAGSNASRCKPSPSSSAPAAAGSSIVPKPPAGSNPGSGAAPKMAVAPIEGATPKGGVTPKEGAATPKGGATSGGGATPGGGVSPGGATPGGGTTPSKKKAPAVGNTPGGDEVLVNSKLATNVSGSGLTLPGSNAGAIVPASGGGSCPPGFINAVFNTNAPQSAGFPGTTWSSMVANGVNQWVGFSLGTLDTKSTYGNPPTTPEFDAAQFHLMMDVDDTDAAVELLQGPNAPPYLGLFNEPDFSFANATKTIEPIPAAEDLARLFAVPHPKTQLVSPALMDANSDWLPTFKSACNGCFDQIPIIAAHLYNHKVVDSLYLIEKLHGTWPDKKIWITELSPASRECDLDAAGIDKYMKELIPALIKLGYVEKIFWNSGEWGMPPINNAPNACNPALTDAQGKGTPILTSLKNACGGGTATA